MTALSPAGKALYRSLLRWCNAPIVRRVPFTLPVLSSELERFFADHSDGKAIRSRTGTRSFIQRTFRAEPEESLDVGFEALRELHDFTRYLENMESHREAREDRSQIEFSVGQVLRHKKFHFRGVVYGWDRRPTVDVSEWDGVQGLSRGADQPFYHLLPAQDDCHLFLGGGRDYTMRYVAEENLVGVEPLESRIHHPLMGHAFDASIPQKGCFLPDDMLVFQYPDPIYEQWAEQSRASPDFDTHCEVVATLASQLWGTLFAQVEAVQRDQPESEVWARLDCLLGEKVAESLRSRGENAVDGHHMPGSQLPVFQHLHQLRALYQVLHALLERRSEHVDRDGVDFKLGEVLRHDQFGFRGVVVGWDTRPTIDVANWEAVVDLPSGADQPFYYILPDLQDSIEAFGSPRGSRYVAQENLSLIADKFDRLISSPQIPTLLPYFDDDQGQFAAIEQLAFQYPQDEVLVAQTMGQEPLHGLIEALMVSIRASLVEAQHSVIPHLMGLLRGAESSEAKVVEEVAWLCWGSHMDVQLQNEFDHGVKLLQTSPESAIVEFSTILEKDPDWTEAWNKRATAYFMADQYDESLRDIDEVLAREPMHFGALSGQGMVRMKSGDLTGAIESYQKALGAHPWLFNTVPQMYRASLQLSKEEGDE